MTSLSGSVSCPMRIAHARFLSDTTHCSTMTSKTSVRPSTAPDNCFGPLDCCNLITSVRLPECSKRTDEIQKKKLNETGRFSVSFFFSPKPLHKQIVISVQSESSENQKRLLRCLNDNSSQLATCVWFPKYS